MKPDLGIWEDTAKAASGFAMCRLSLLTGLGIESSLAFVSPDELGGPMARLDREAAGIRMGVSGAGSGRMLVMQDLESARGLVHLLSNREPCETGAAVADRLTALAELGETLGRAFVDALMVETALPFSMSAPCVQIERPDVMLSYLAAGSQPEAVGTRVAQTTFSAAGGRHWGTLYFAPGADLHETLRRASRAA